MGADFGKPDTFRFLLSAFQLSAFYFFPVQPEGFFASRCRLGLSK